MKGYFNLESPLSRPFAFEVRFNVIELHHIFDQKHAGTPNPVAKKSAPEIVRSIGLITSANSEAVSDFHEGLKKTKRYVKIEIQGVNLLNPESISTGIREADKKGHDVLVITRGGGPDLYLFNDPAIVAAIAACKTFTMTGLGHAKNKTECDRVSDMSVETPTSAGVQIGKLVSSKYFADKKNVLSPHFSIKLERTSPSKNFARRILHYAGAFVLGFAVFVGKRILNIGKRILMLGLFFLGGILVQLIISLLLQGSV